MYIVHFSILSLFNSGCWSIRCDHSQFTDTHSDANVVWSLQINPFIIEHNHISVKICLICTITISCWSSELMQRSVHWHLRMNALNVVSFQDDWAKSKDPAYRDVGVIDQVAVDEPAAGAQRLAHHHHRRNAVTVPLGYVIILSTVWIKIRFDMRWKHEARCA